MRPGEGGVIMNVDLRRQARKAQRVESGGLGGTERSRMGLGRSDRGLGHTAHGGGLSGDVGVLPIALREESMALASAGKTVVMEGLP